MSKVGKGCPSPVTGSVSLTPETIAAICDCISNSMAAGIELGATQVGCIKDASGVVTGAVFLCVQKGEDGSDQGTVVKAVDFATGNIIDPYTGVIELCDAPVVSSIVPVVLEELCMSVDDVVQALTPVASWDTSTGQFVGAAQYLDETGLPVVGTVIAVADPCLCCPEPCGDACPNVTLPAGCGQLGCAILRVDATPASLSQSTFETFTMELSVMNDDGTVNTDCAAVVHNFDTETLTIVKTPTGDAVSNFADAISGLEGFDAVPCGDSVYGERIAVKGPDCYSWRIWLRSGGSGDDFALGYDLATNALYEIEQPQGSSPIQEPANASAAYDGYFSPIDCGDCAF